MTYISEPGHGNSLQLHRIALRYPIVTEGKLQGMVSILVQTETLKRERSRPAAGK